MTTQVLILLLNFCGNNQKCFDLYKECVKEEQSIERCVEAFETDEMDFRKAYGVK